MKVQSANAFRFSELSKPSLLSEHVDSFCVYDSHSHSQGSYCHSEGEGAKPDRELTMDDLQQMMRLPTFDQRLFPGPASSKPFADDEYGHFDEWDHLYLGNVQFEDLPLSTGTSGASSRKSNVSLSSSTSGSLSGSLSGSTSMTSSSASSRSQSLDDNVLCVLENRKAPTACRSFEHVKACSPSVPVCLSIRGFRVVQDGYQEEAEYKFVLDVDGRERVCWKKFADFRSLGEACRVYSGRCRSQRRPPMRQTIAAWEKVVSHRPWWSKPQCTVDYLCAEARLLECFMKNLLFEVPCMQMLLEFAA